MGWVVVLYVMLVSKRFMVELVHAVVGLGVDESPPDGHKYSQDDNKDKCNVNNDESPPAEYPVHQFRQEA